MKKKLFPQNKKLTWRLIYYKKSDLVELIHMFFLYAFWLGDFPFILVNRILHMRSCNWGMQSEQESSPEGAKWVWRMCVCARH